LSKDFELENTHLCFATKAEDLYVIIG